MNSLRQLGWRGGLAAAALAIVLGASPAAAQTNLPGGIFIAIPPCRIVDTRNVGGAFTSQQTRSFNVVGLTTNYQLQGGTSATGCNIPGFFLDQKNISRPGIAAVEVNYIAISGASNGNLKAWPADQAEPATSVINYTTGVNIANGTVVGVRQDVAGGDIKIKASQPVQVVVDIVGYYALPGYQNSNPGFLSGVGSGFQNAVSGPSSVITGGQYNVVDAPDSFATGTAAYIDAAHFGTTMFTDDVVDADNSTPFFASAAPREFAVRATGGVRFITSVNLSTVDMAEGAPINGCILAPGGGSWSCTSDRNVKKDFETIDGKDILKRLAGIPIQAWRYKTEQGAPRHIGPMAQDFAKAFAVGSDDKHITGVDADGVALSAIQGLYTMPKEKDPEIAKLSAPVPKQGELMQVQGRRIDELVSRSAAQEVRLKTVEKAAPATASAVAIPLARISTER